MFKERVDGKNQVQRGGTAAIVCLFALLFVGCMSTRGPSLRTRLARVAPPADGGPEILVWDGWHALDVRGELRDRLVVAYQLEQEGYHTAALRFLDALVRVHPESIPLHEARGVLQARAGFPRAAEREFERALQGDPERPELWYALGRVRLQLELPTSALESFLHAEELGAGGYRLHRDVARALRALGRWSEAAERYDWSLACEGGPRCELLVEAATLAVDCRAPTLAPPAWRKAFALVSEAEALEPDSPRVWFVHGLLSECQGDLPRAIANYEAALDRDPLFLPALLNLALAARHAQDDARTEEAARRALALEEDGDRRALLEELLAAAPPTLAAVDE